ncbi:MipA/OmpV family protein [Pantoea sp. S18]|uniref:MipA/OmpV family protein n=1 Tax=Pantoea sp. S18 TaxID=3019892 RepID=UPI0012AD4A21|nr:MipA/OmpV family protein [Pantoea sp. S18]MEA5101000.1 MipA/OmpV family protein [Pantoea sp. S18]MRT42921.1 MipA/OmpV family protein [Enterobacteriaceae bacterium RIT702]
MHSTLAQPLALFCLLSAASFPVLADSSQNEFSGFIGGGVGVKPKYSGAKENKTDFVPAIKLNYGPLFVGGVDDLIALGWNVVKTDRWTFALGVGTNISPRQESDDPHLKGLGDIDVTPRAFTSAIYENDYFKGGVILTQDVGGNQQGFKLASYAHLQWRPTQSLRLFTGPNLSWADSDYMQTQYGVTAAQSARSGLARYDAGAGIEKVGWEAGVEYALTPAWLIGARVNAQHLENHAADSPITEEKGQASGVLYAAWRF